jgi:acetolactate synthase small subunit
MRHVISALVINEPGVLANVAGMFAARGFNIDSLVVGRTENPEFSRMTIVVNADENTLEQVRKQLGKLIPVVKIRDFKEISYVERDLLLVNVAVGPEKRNEVVDIVNLFRGHQRAILGLLQQSRSYKGMKMITKDKWVAIMRAAGLDDEAMHRWHREFEKAAPTEHQEFLEFLHIAPTEIEGIRKSSRGEKKA